jgi:hypothetical protein
MQPLPNLCSGDVHGNIQEGNLFFYLPTPNVHKRVQRLLPFFEQVKNLKPLTDAKLNSETQVTNDVLRYFELLRARLASKFVKYEQKNLSHKFNIRPHPTVDHHCLGPPSPYLAFIKSDYKVITYSLLPH